MQVPVLTYHSNNIASNTYAGNDHLALAADLETLRELGLRVVSLAAVADWQAGRRDAAEVAGAVALSFDDGSWFDFHDLDHPTCGPQRSFFNLIRSAGACASFFVITSPAARAVLDQRSLIGRGWWGDDWWAIAQASGSASIECHSWDHVHPDLDQVAQSEGLKGDFTAVSSEADCDAQVAQAGDYIANRLGGKRPRHFAYPWGQASRYLLDEYMPGQRFRHGFEAAFSTEPRPVTRADSPWFLPRFVCGRDWQSPAGFRDLLRRFVH